MSWHSTALVVLLSVTSAKALPTTERDQDKPNERPRRSLKTHYSIDNSAKVVELPPYSSNVVTHIGTDLNKFVRRVINALDPRAAKKAAAHGGGGGGGGRQLNHCDLDECWTEEDTDRNFAWLQANELKPQLSFPLGCYLKEWQAIDINMQKIAAGGWFDVDEYLPSACLVLCVSKEIEEGVDDLIQEIEDVFGGEAPFVVDQCNSMDMEFSGSMPGLVFGLGKDALNSVDIKCEDESNCGVFCLAGPGVNLPEEGQTFIGDIIETIIEETEEELNLKGPACNSVTVHQNDNADAGVICLGSIFYFDGWSSCNSVEVKQDVEWSVPSEIAPGHLVWDGILTIPLELLAWLLIILEEPTGSPGAAVFEACDSWGHPTEYLLEFMFNAHLSDYDLNKLESWDPPSSQSDDDDDDDGPNDRRRLQEGAPWAFPNDDEACTLFVSGLLMLMDDMMMEAGVRDSLNFLANLQLITATVVTGSTTTVP